MGNLTIRASDDLLDALDAEAEANDESRAELVRRVLRERDARDDRIDALESQLAECETECERLRREKRQMLDQREEHTQLVEAVERERSLAEKRAEASAAQRFRWWLWGHPPDE